MDLEPIEHHLRVEDPPSDAILLIRGGPIAVEKLVEHARRQEREFSWQGAPMASVSVDATVFGWTEEIILRERLWSRTTFAGAAVGAVRQAGFRSCPPTGDRTTMLSSPRRRLQKHRGCSPSSARR